MGSSAQETLALGVSRWYGSRHGMLSEKSIPAQPGSMAAKHSLSCNPAATSLSLTDLQRWQKATARPCPGQRRQGQASPSKNSTNVSSFKAIPVTKAIMRNSAISETVETLKSHHAQPSHLRRMQVAPSQPSAGQPLPAPPDSGQGKPRKPEGFQHLPHQLGALRLQGPSSGSITSSSATAFPPPSLLPAAPGSHGVEDGQQEDPPVTRLSQESIKPGIWTGKVTPGYYTM